MTNKFKNLEKRKILIPLMAIILIGIVSAGIGLNAMEKSRGIDKVLRDELLSQTDAIEINPAIDIKQLGDSCKYSAVQKDIINSYDNVFNCSGMSNDEIQNYIADEVLIRLENYANVSIQRESYEDWGTGTVEITEGK